MADLTTITERSTVNIVLMCDIKANGGDGPALQNALDKNADAAALNANVDTNATALKAKVTDARYTTDQVVAVPANDYGSLAVVTNDSVRNLDVLGALGGAGHERLLAPSCMLDKVVRFPRAPSKIGFYQA